MWETRWTKLFFIWWGWAGHEDHFPSDTESEHACSSISGDIFEESSDNFEESSDIFNEGAEDSSSDHEKDHNFGFVSCGNQPIYEGADLTHNQSLLLLMSFVLKHQLTDEALNDFWP